MSVSIEQWKSELATLTAEARAELAHFLIDSLEEGVDEDAESAWDVELTRRADEIRRGDAVGKPADQVFAELREKYS